VKLTDDVKQRKQKHFKQYRTAKQKPTNKENLVRFLHRGKPRKSRSSFSHLQRESRYCRDRDVWIEFEKAVFTLCQHSVSRVDKSMESLFWSMFGLTDLDTFGIDKSEFQIAQETGVMLFNLYQVLIVIVVINMLIAMMTRSFKSIMIVALPLV